MQAAAMASSAPASKGAGAFNEEQISAEGYFGLSAPTRNVDEVRINLPMHTKACCSPPHGLAPDDRTAVPKELAKFSLDDAKWAEIVGKELDAAMGKGACGFTETLLGIITCGVTACKGSCCLCAQNTAMGKWTERANAELFEPAGLYCKREFRRRTPAALLSCDTGTA